jgi:iron complex transport system substrate-binding protein
MAARTKRLIVVVALLSAGLPFAARGTVFGQRPAPAQRIVSLVPALTEILFAIGAGPQVVGVSSFDEFPPEVRTLPRVGALLDPDTERILSLRPDLVIVYGSQAEQETRFNRAGIRTLSYRHGGIETVLGTIRALGAATAHDHEAAAVAADIQRRIDRVRERVRGRPRPRVLLVFDRQPRSLREIYVSGGRGFLHEMIEIAGGANVFADVPRESVQPSQETLLARSPDVIIEVRAAGLLDDREVAEERGVWSALPGVPAVRAGRVHLLSGQYLVAPGPRLAQATEAFARVLHPDAMDRR